MLYALAALICCTAGASQDAPRHVLDRLPLAAPDKAAFIGLASAPGGGRALVDDGGALRFMALEVDEGSDVLAGTLGPRGAVGLVESGPTAALDPDGDGREAPWFVDGAGLLEITETFLGAPGPGRRVELPGAGATFTRDGLVVLPGGLVGAVAAQLGAEPRFVALWSGPARACVRVDGGPFAALCAVAADGSAWLATPHATFELRLAEQARDLLAHVDASGVLVLLYRGASSERLRRARLDRVVDGAFAGADLPLAVEDDDVRLAQSWLVDVDADGDLDLVANEHGRLIARAGWGDRGFLAPRALVADVALDVRRSGSAVLASTARSVVRVELHAARTQVAPAIAAPLRAFDFDGDGDRDLVAGDRLATNDASGRFTWRGLDHSSMSAASLHAAASPAAITLPAHLGPTDAEILAGDAEADTFLVRAPSGAVQLLRRDGGEWTLSAPRVAPSGAILVDVDEDGDDDLVALADGHLTTWLGPRHVAPSGGAIRQFGTGLPGSGAVVPVLGASGPVRHGEPRGDVNVVNAAVDCDVFIAVTPFEWVLDLRGSGMATRFDASQLAWLGGRTRGSSAEPGSGRWQFPLTFAPDLVGHTLYGQAFVVDRGAPGGISVSNRLAVTYGR